MYEEWFQSMADDEDMPTPEEVAAIEDFIDGKVSAKDAAERCTSRIAAQADPDPTLLWSLFESMAVELPNTQDQVVELLAAIKKVPDPIRNEQVCKIEGEKVFSQLAYFETGFSDYWAGLRNIPRAPDQPSGPERWAAINAFSARMTTRFVKDFRKRAIYTIEDALDKEYLEDARTREFFLNAAANQLIYAAIPLWHLGNNPGVAPRPSPFPDWVAWRSGMGTITERADLSGETRNRLREAIGIMDSVSQNPENNTWECE